MDPVSAFYNNYNRGDLDAVMELFTPDARLENCVLGETYDGVPAIRGFFDDFADIVEEPRAFPGEPAEDEGLILVPIKLGGRLRHTGITEEIMPTELVHGFELRDCKLAWFAICDDHVQVMQAAGKYD